MKLRLTEAQTMYRLEEMAYETWSGRRVSSGLPAYGFTTVMWYFGQLESTLARYEFERNYPEHVKLEAIPEAERNAIGSFIEWLEYESRYDICRKDKRTQLHYPINPFPEKLLAMFYGIDQQKLSEEKDRMYKSYVSEVA